MKLYAKIIDEATKECSVQDPVGTNFKFYESIGMKVMDVEEGANGRWYLSGHVPEAPHELELSYSERRAAEYPSIEEQLDILYHGGLRAWKAHIKAIKDKYPKPTETELAEALNNEITETEDAEQSTVV